MASSASGTRHTLSSEATGDPQVCATGDPQFLECNIHDNKFSGVDVREAGGGCFDKCVIKDNMLHGKSSPLHLFNGSLTRVLSGAVCTGGSPGRLLWQTVWLPAHRHRSEHTVSQIVYDVDAIFSQISCIMELTNGPRQFGVACSLFKSRI